MKVLILVGLSSLLGGCVGPALLASCAAEAPFKNVGKVRTFAAEMKLAAASGVSTQAATIQCKVSDYSCDARGFGLHEVWETIPEKSFTLAGSINEEAMFKIETPNCYGLVESTKGNDPYGHWHNPRMEVNGKVVNVPIWFPQDRVRFADLGIKQLTLRVVELER